jgi:inosine/xanthosine triphosphatase
MLKIVVGSQNPVKINAAKSAFSQVFSGDKIQCEAASAPSGVADQPMTSQATREGAISRVKYCQQHFDADFYLAIEGGVDYFDDGPATFAYIAIANKQTLSVGRSANLPLPKVIYQSLKNGDELGHVMDRLFKTDNVKQKQGAIGLLTNGQATRESIYTQAVILAIAPFLHTDLYNQ